MEFVDRAGQVWEVDLSGMQGTFTRVLVVETLPPPSDSPGARRFINHRCIVMDCDDYHPQFRAQLMKTGEMILTEDLDLENDWNSKRRAQRTGNYIPPIYRRLV